ncbi:MAG: hypothetical protein IKS37_01850 [Solobacterium sp.]|nr:hypothetical protein [Solobacterium sp.]
MRSQTIKIRNLPHDPTRVTKTVNVKPVLLLLFLLLLGGIFLAIRAYLLVGGIFIAGISLFALLVMPDRILCQFTDEYLVLYNTREKDECNLLYWDEIVSWQYEWHPSVDLLVIQMIDGSTETQEMYSKRSIAGMMRRYIPGKEIRSSRIRKGNA